jgi:hypothetical protein
MAFPLSCTGRCQAEWRAPFLPGAPFATGAASAPALVDGAVLVGDVEGRLWAFRSSCGDTRCEPLASYDVATAALHTPAVEGDQVVVTATDGVVARVRMDCAADDDECEPVRVRITGSRALAPAVIASDSVIVGAKDGSLEAFPL